MGHHGKERFIGYFSRKGRQGAENAKKRERVVVCKMNVEFHAMHPDKTLSSPLAFFASLRLCERKFQNNVYGVKVQSESGRKRFIPGFNTIKILEKRKKYIVDKMESKLESKTEKETYFKSLTDEIKALEKTTNFIKWIQNNFADDMVREIINKYELENEKSFNEENEAEEAENQNDGIVYGIIDEKQGKDRKFEITFSRDEGINYVSIASQRRKKNNITWEKTNEIKMTVNKLEKILRKEKEIENHQIPSE